MTNVIYVEGISIGHVGTFFVYGVIVIELNADSSLVLCGSRFHSYRVEDISWFSRHMEIL